MIWLRKVGAETQGKNVSLPLMRELHGEWEKIPRAKVSNLVGEEPRALIKRTRFRVAVAQYPPMMAIIAAAPGN